MSRCRFRVLVSMAALAAWFAFGCGDEQKPTETKTGMAPDKMLWVMDRVPDPGKRIATANELASLSGEQLKPVIPQLKAAVAKEKSPMVKQALQQALDKAQGGGGK